MKKIKLIMDNFDPREVCLSVTHDYYPDKTKVKIIENELCKDIIITIEHENYIDKIYGREIQGKYYYARHNWISKKQPDIDYYEEFFSNGIEIQLG